jgi:hypothetical protein
MPRVTPVAEIDQMEPEQEILLLRGKIGQLFDSKRGDNEHGPWSFQRGTLKDASGERKFVLKNRSTDIPKQWRGQEVVIEAHKTDKGYSGIYTMDDDFRGKTTRCIKVTETAAIYLADIHAAAAAPPPKPAQTPSGNGQSGAQAPRGDVGTAAPVSNHTAAPSDRIARQRHAVIDAKRKAARLANLFTIAVDAVENVIVPHWDEVIGKGTMPDEQHQGAVATLFIAMQRDGAHDDLPLKPLAEFMAEADKNNGEKQAQEKAEAERIERERAEAESRAKAEALRKEAANYTVDDDEIPF